MLEYVELCCLRRGSHVLVVPASLLDNGWGLGGTLLEQEVALDEVRQPGGQLVVEEGLGRDRKDLIDFFQSELLGFADEGEDHEPCNQIQCGIETKGTSCGHYALHTRVCQTEDTG